MEKNFYIPRASLTPSCGSSNSSSMSLSSNQRKYSLVNVGTHVNIGNRIDRTSNKDELKNSQGKVQKSSFEFPEEVLSEELSLPKNALKRGSRSSQGSHDSHHSSQSATSGSMLLTVENLERFSKFRQDHAENTNYLSTIISIDPTKACDAMSIASSTHFTMVNGERGLDRKTKSGICSRGKQVTVLIISMSMIFLLGILGMVYALQMRASKMPQM